MSKRTKQPKIEYAVLSVRGVATETSRHASLAAARKDAEYLRGVLQRLRYTDATAVIAVVEHESQTPARPVGCLPAPRRSLP